MDTPASPNPHTAPAFLPACAPAYLRQARAWKASGIPDLKTATLRTSFPAVLTHPNVAAKRIFAPHVSEPGPTVERGGDAGVVRARLNSIDRLIAHAAGGNARFAHLNPRQAAIIAVVEGLRRLACTGAVPFAISSRITMAEPTKPEDAWLLSEAIAGLTEAEQHFGFPELGSGLSLLATGGGSVPVPSVAVVGQIEQEKFFTRQAVRAAGESLVLLGAAPTELGGSQYLGIIHQLYSAGDAPECPLPAALKLHQAVLALIKSGQVRGANSLNEGGLLCCVTEMLFIPGQTFGANLDLATLQGNRLDALLFGESQNRVVIVVGADRVPSVLAEAHLRGVSAAVIGEVTKEPVLTVRGTTDDAVSWPLEELRTAWERAVAAKLAQAGLPA